MPCPFYFFDLYIKYLNDLENVFESLVFNPHIGHIRNEIKDGLLSISQKEHIVFYRILKSHIRIVRILHGSKDIPKSFKKITD